MSTFWEKYKDPRWQRRRLEVMQNVGFCCEGCGSDSKTLNVHHKLYRKGHEPWEYNDLELMCLCEGCHEHWHWLKENFNVALQYIDLDSYREVVGYAIGVGLRTAHPETEVHFKSPEGKRGIARALNLTDEQINANCSPEGDITAGVLQEMYLRSLTKKRRRK